MSSRQRAEFIAPEPAVLIYSVVCLLGLMLVLLTQASLGIGLLELFLVVVGLLGVVTRWRMAPVMVLFLLGICQFGHPYTAMSPAWQRGVWTLHGPDLLVCCGMLAYVAGHYRLQGLTRTVLPTDLRQRQGPERRGLLWRHQGKLVFHPRASRLVTPGELFGFLLGLPLSVLLAQVVWSLVDGPYRRLGLPPGLGRFVTLAWLLGVSALVVGSLLDYWRRQSLSPQEAEQMLHDTLWRETRREQRRLARWLAWSHWRRQQREEAS
jgi:hypothetical protein